MVMKNHEMSWSLKMHFPGLGKVVDFRENGLQ